MKLHTLYTIFLRPCICILWSIIPIQFKGRLRNALPMQANDFQIIYLEVHLFIINYVLLI